VQKETYICKYKIQNVNLFVDFWTIIASNAFLFNVVIYIYIYIVIITDDRAKASDSLKVTFRW
jgi:hypothetical protein